MGYLGNFRDVPVVASVDAWGYGFMTTADAPNLVSLAGEVRSIPVNALRLVPAEHP
jgi:hypothetical protein